MTEPDSTAELLDDRTTSFGRPGSGAPGGRLEPRWRVAGISAVVTLAVAVIVLYSPDSKGVAPAPAEPSASPVAALGTPTAAPLVPEGPCLTDRVQIDSPADPSVPGWYRPTRVTASGVAAFVVDETRNRGSIVVSGGDAGGTPSSRRVAIYTTSDPAGSVEVAPIGWSASGDTLLVRADQFGGSGEEGSCANLFLVKVDGSGVIDLTDNGPGTFIFESALAPKTGQTAYLQDGDLHVLDPVRGDSAVASCESAWSLGWSRDERRLLGICNGADLLVADTLAGTSGEYILPDELSPLAATWAADGSSITVVATMPGTTSGAPLAALDFDPATATFERRSNAISSAPTLGLAALSPDGRWIIVVGQRQDSDPGTVMAAVDLATGVSTDLPSPPATDVIAATSFAWLGDGETALYGLGGSLYTINVATATLTDVGILPASQFVWYNAPRLGL